MSLGSDTLTDGSDRSCTQAGSSAGSDTVGCGTKTEYQSLKSTLAASDASRMASSKPITSMGFPNTKTSC